MRPVLPRADRAPPLTERQHLSTCLHYTALDAPASFDTPLPDCYSTSLMLAAASLKATCLNALHRSTGAKMVDFGGWDMPVQYSSLVDEHLTVRKSVGVFDVSHMGEIDITGPEALQLTDFVTTNAAGRLQTGQIQYAGLLYEHGGFVDDVLVHKVSGDHYFLCVNASNQEKDYEHIRAQNRFDAEVRLSSGDYAQLAIQGPQARATLQKLTPVNLTAIRYYWFADGTVSGTPARIARTGYTGENGFEIYIDPAEAPRLWTEILEAGHEFGIKPCGLGARNTLRLEAKMALYGHEIHASITPWEADLDWIVKLDKADFVGRAALVRQKQQGVHRRLTGFEMRGRGIGRDGWVTSGSPSPTLNKNIGLCFLPVEEARVGRAIEVVVRSQPVAAVTVETPFYKRAK
jgi:aminomethyltransferase